MRAPHTVPIIERCCTNGALNMNKSLEDLIRISKAVGRDGSLVQGGGGNTSVKTPNGRHMYIKASGCALKDMAPRAGWRKLRLDRVLSILDDGSVAKLDPARRETDVVNRLNLSCDDGLKNGGRPSVESHLHALFDRYVIHLHPITVGAYVCSRNGREWVEALFGGRKYPPLWVPYVNPGFTLASKISGLVKSYRKNHGRIPSIVFLQKHGLIVSASSAGGALRAVRDVVEACGKGLKREKRARLKPPAPDELNRTRLAVRRALFDETGKYVSVRHDLGDAVSAFMRSRRARKLAEVPATTPDEIVYAGGAPAWIGKPDTGSLRTAVRRRVRAEGKPPSGFLVKGQGLFLAGSERSVSVAKEVLAAALSVRVHAADFGGPNALTPRQRRFISEWEAESFRQNLAGASGGGPLEGRIAVVTGAGSGLGRSVAVGLARAGANVALADVDLDAVEATGFGILDEKPHACVLPVPCDVTSEGAVRGAFDMVLDRWGGLDILVNAAGIAPAFDLVDLPADLWRKALEINLTGYFLMARAAARVMTQQGMGGSIVNLSSKSGLEASRSNTPYNATKAGEIHMARGWALELGRHGIRVNSVAPGNVFEGSKIWNPKYIRTCARKYGIKPEQVIPYYVGKTALGREIRGQDVADAVVFLCSDSARTITGQTVVPDGGQVMVR